MRISGPRGVVTTIAIATAVALAGCGTDEASSTSSPPTSSTSTAPSSSTPASPIDLLPLCSTLEPGPLPYVTPAEWLPADVPSDWQLRAAATVRPVVVPPLSDGVRMAYVVDGLVTGELLIRSGSSATPIDGSAVAVRGTQGVWGHLGGRSIEAANPILAWREGGVDWSVVAHDMTDAQAAAALAPLELSADPLSVHDPSGAMVQVADRSRGGPSVMTVLSYSAPGGTGTVSPGVPPSESGPTDLVEVIIEQFAPGNSAVVPIDMVNSIGTSIGRRLDTSGERPILHGEPGVAIAVEVVSGPSEVSNGSDVAVTTSVAGSPDVDQARQVVARVDAVVPSDERLAQAQVAMGAVEVTPCRPDGAD